MTEFVPSVEATAQPAATQPATTEEKPQQPGVGVTIAKNSLWLLVDSAVAMTASFYCSVMVARGLGPDRMGDYNFILMFANVLRMVTEVAIPVTVRKFGAELMGRGDYTALKTLLHRAMRLQVKLASTGASIGLAIVFIFFSPDKRVFAALAVLSIVPSLLISIPAGALWATENLRPNVIASVSATAVNVAGVTLSVIMHWGLMGVITSFLASRVVDFFLRYLMYRRVYVRMPGETGNAIDPELKKRMIPFAARQMVLTALYVLLFDRMEVFFLKGLAPTREIAFFSISFTVVQYLNVVPSALGTSTSVTLMVQQGRAPGEVANIAATATWFMLLVTAPMVFGVAAVCDPLLRLLYGAQYIPAIPVMTVLALFGISQALGQPVQNLLVATERQTFYMSWAAFMAVINVLGNVVLIPKLGAVGAAYSKGTTQLIAAIGYLAYMVVQFRVRLPVFRMIKLLVACATMFAGVRLLGRSLPSLAALLLGIPAGIVIFVVMTRLLRCLQPADGERLRSLAKMLPAPARDGYRAFVRFLAPV